MDPKPTNNNNKNNNPNTSDPNMTGSGDLMVKSSAGSSCLDINFRTSNSFMSVKTLKISISGKIFVAMSYDRALLRGNPALFPHCEGDWAIRKIITLHSPQGTDSICVSFDDSSFSVSVKSFGVVLNSPDVRYSNIVVDAITNVAFFKLFSTVGVANLQQTAQKHAEEILLGQPVATNNNAKNADDGPRSVHFVAMAPRQFPNQVPKQVPNQVPHRVPRQVPAPGGPPPDAKIIGMPSKKRLSDFLPPPDITSASANKKNKPNPVVVVSDDEECSSSSSSAAAAEAIVALSKNRFHCGPFVAPAPAQAPAETPAEAPAQDPIPASTSEPIAEPIADKDKFSHAKSGLKLIPQHQIKFKGMLPCDYFSRNIWHKNWLEIFADPFFIRCIWKPVVAMLNGMGHNTAKNAKRVREYMLWSFKQFETDISFYRNATPAQSATQCEFCQSHKFTNRTWVFFENGLPVYTLSVDHGCHLRLKAILRIFQCLWGCTTDEYGFYKVYKGRTDFADAKAAWKELDNRMCNALYITSNIRKYYSTTRGGVNRVYHPDLFIRPTDPGYDSADSEQGTIPATAATKAFSALP